MESEAWTLQDLIGLLAERILDAADFIRCSVVSEVWKSCFLEYKPAQPGPWLMSVDRKDSDKRDFYNLSDGNLLSFNLPEVIGRYFLATNYGWLFTLGLDMAIHLLHPLSRIQIPLPSAHMFTNIQMIDDKNWMRSLFIKNVCLSSDPKEENCVVMVTYSGPLTLAFLRLGDKSWTNIELPLPSYNDLIHYNGIFFAIRTTGDLVACDVNLPKPQARIVARDLPPRSDGLSWGPKPVYVVESHGNILAVARRITCHWIEGEIIDGVDIKDYYTTSFEVYKMDSNGENTKMKWSRVMSLGDCALFVGRTVSMSISTKNTKGIRRNCVYFTDDSTQFYDSMLTKKWYDQGIFCLDDGKIERYIDSDLYSSYISPGWMTFSPFSL